MTDFDPIDVRLGASVRARREELRITQAELAKQIGVTFQQVQKYEKGTNRISASRLVRIANVLQTTASELLGEGGGDAHPGATALVELWSQIPDAQQRQAVLSLVRTMRVSA